MERILLTESKRCRLRFSQSAAERFGDLSERGSYALA